MVVSVYKPGQHTPLLVQAPVRALDPDGAGILTIGTLAFSVASVVCWFQLDALRAIGQGWWLGVCLIGVLIGAAGMAIAWRAHRRRRAQGIAEPALEASADGEDDPASSITETHQSP